MPRRVGWGLALTAQNEIVVQNEIKLKTVQNKDSDQKMHQNLQNNATYMYSVRNERIMVTLLSPKSELKHQLSSKNEKKKTNVIVKNRSCARPRPPLALIFCSQVTYKSYAEYTRYYTMYRARHWTPLKFP